MNDIPTYTKWKRKHGGMKVCPSCKHHHKPVMRIGGTPQRVKTCVKCGAVLPSRLAYSKRSRVTWYVREFNPTTGRCKDQACSSSEHADELIRRRRRDFTPDAVKAKLMEHVSSLIRNCISAKSSDDAINELIRGLGGDASVRSLKSIEWKQAVEIICDELTQKGRSSCYIDDIHRVTAMFRTATGVSNWVEVTLDTVAVYRKTRMAGGWQWKGRTIKAVQGRAINKDLATLSAFLSRAARKGWIKCNILENAPDERIKVRAVRVKYMPDNDLHALVKAADQTWLRTLVILAYYTGARRGDLLRLEWDRDIDWSGAEAAGEGRIGPHLYVQGYKADTPHWMPLHPVAVRELSALRNQPVLDRKVFPIRESINPGSRVSHLFADLCIKAGLTKILTRDGITTIKNKWSLHDLRKKANTDLRNSGASPKERAALLGHRTTAVNESHYEALLPGRERTLIDSLPSFGLTA